MAQKVRISPLGRPQMRLSINDIYAARGESQAIHTIRLSINFKVIIGGLKSSLLTPETSNNSFGFMQLARRYEYLHRNRELTISVQV